VANFLDAQKGRSKDKIENKYLSKYC